MKHPRFALALCVSLAVPLALAAGQRGLEISTVNGNDREKRAVEQLERIWKEYDLARWTFTTKIQIESMATPHSHPILTLNTRYLDDDVSQATTFAHEQFHWWVIEDGRAPHRRAAMAEFAEIFPEAPPNRDQGGARDLESTYLHLVVCDLEFQAATALAGEAVARELLAGKTHYQWIYEQVLDNPVVREVNARHGLIVPLR